MLAGIFVYGGIDAVRHPEGKATKAELVGPAIAEKVGLPSDPVTLVRINGAVQVGAGTLLAFGKCRRLASVALAASLAPTTYAGHRFWEETDPVQRKQQQVHFLKNVAMLGGLILAAGDTGGRPSVTWRAKRATKRAVQAARPATSGVTQTASKLSREATRDAAAGATIATMQMAQLSRKAAKAAKRAAEVAGGSIAETAGRTREALSDLPVDQVRESAVHLAHGLVERGREIPVDKMRESAVHLAHGLVERGREIPVDKMRESAAQFARDIAERGREVLPIAS